jgi:3-methyladenine DNA glycosylase/8-oxoguanine DNA glycosylase
MPDRAWTTEIPLAGPGGEPVDLWRTIESHGLVDLPPMRIEEESRALEITVPLPSSRPRTLEISQGRAGHAKLTAAGRAPGKRQAAELEAAAAYVLRLDEDLSPFYAAAAADPDLAWATQGAGRLVRSPTVFEEVVKTICTTNCAWSATERMVGALVEHLGEPAAGAADGPYGRAFPTPAAMAATDEAFYRDVARTGYRGAYLRSLATDVDSGALDLEAFGRAGRDEVPDDDLAALLLALPGVGPYAAAHIMMLLGRYSRLVLDSWTRPKYAGLNGGRPVKDATIERRFRRYGQYAGLAFWLVLTRDWVADG